MTQATVFVAAVGWREEEEEEISDDVFMAWGSADARSFSLSPPPPPSVLWVSVCRHTLVGASSPSAAPQQIFWPRVEMSTLLSRHICLTGLSRSPGGEYDLL